MLWVATELADDALAENEYQSLRRRTMRSQGHVRGAGGARVNLSVEQHAVNDVDHAIRQEDVRLHDLGGDVARSHEVSGGVENEAEWLSCGRGEVLARELRRVYRGAIDEL